jgi:chromosome segregation ATPase
MFSGLFDFDNSLFGVDETKRLKAEMDILKKELRDSRANNEELTKALEDSKANNEELEKKVKDSTASNQELEKELENSKANNQELERELDDSIAYNEELDKENKVIKEIVKALEKEADSEEYSLYKPIQTIHPKPFHMLFQ